MYVEELMTSCIWACTPETTLDQAVKLMEEHDCGWLPVVPGRGRYSVVGVITDRDICLAAHHLGTSLKNVLVREVMSVDVATCSLKDKVSTAWSVLRRSQVRRLPVLDDEGQLVGLVTLAQLARFTGERAPFGVSTTQVAKTLASISRPSRSPSWATMAWGT
jgi:CBS-domain-containing membrane protein